MAKDNPIDSNNDISLLDDDSVGRIKKSSVKMALMALFVAACIAVVHFSPLKMYLSDFQALIQLIRSTGYWAPAVYVAASAGLMFVGAPRLPFCVLGGILFGFVQGLILSQVATMAGAYGPYLFARYNAKAWVDKKLEKYQKFKKLLKNPGYVDIVMFRQVPMWGLFINLFLGSVGVAHRQFIVGSLVGFLPQGIIFTLIGAGFGEASFLKAFSKVWAAIAVVLVAAVITWRVVLKARRNRQKHVDDSL